MTTIESLPPEVLQSIISYSNPSSAIGRTNGLIILHGVNSYLRSIAEGYARSLLKQNANIATKSIPKNTFAKKWLQWLGNTCQFCKKQKTKRRAIFWNDITCCSKCDKAIPKVTMTNAAQEHHLSKLDLFTPNLLHPNLPSLLSGTTKILGGSTVLISREDVLARQKVIEGMLDDSEKLRWSPRIAAHERLLHALNIVCSGGKFYKMIPYGATKKILETEEGRQSYVKSLFEKERRKLGMSTDGRDLNRHIERMLERDVFIP